MRTSVPSIYASGDVVDKPIPRLTPTAEFESNYIASLLLGETDAPICYPDIPNLVFTLPRIAQVGVSVAEAEKDTENYRVVSVPYGIQNEWIDNRETDIELTYVFDKEDYLVGAAIYGSDAGTWIDFLTLIINKLYACAKEVVRQYREPLEALNLTYTQYIVMMVLWEFGEMTEGELGKKVYLNSGTLAPLLKRLQKAGYINRVRPENNESRLLVSLTPEGENLKELARKVPPKMLGCIPLPEDDLFLLRDLLNRALANMDKNRRR